MNFPIILESLKFYKSHHERTVQLWFILLYGLNLLPFVLPIGDKDFTGYAGAVQEMLNGQMPTQNVLQVLTPGNWLIMGLLVLCSLISSFFSLMYATLYVGETEAMLPRQAVMRSLAAIPRLALLVVLLAVPVILSACLGFVPALVFAMMMYFLPLNLTLNKQSLPEAMHQSYGNTQKQKFFIFAQVVLLTLLLTLPQNIIESLIPAGYLPLAFISSFFAVLKAFIQGRLMGILYLFLVRKAPVVIPSIPNGQKRL